MGWREAVAEALGDPVADSSQLSGGSIAHARRVRLASGREVFVKTFGGKPDMFRKEAAGLRELARPSAIRVPEVLVVGDDFLVLEFIPSGRGGPGLMADFGRRLARMHRQTSDFYGFEEDNYCGSTVQRNTPTQPAAGDWAGFYWEYRLEFQWRLAERQGYASGELSKLMERLEGRIEGLLAGSEEPPSILHGDLWSGNLMVSADGEPVLIDPAAYYGHREAELGMTRLFGNFGSSFYAAYEEEFPLPAGHRERNGLYMLYHVLNHLNLFGMGYHGQAVDILRQYCR